jgi:hypothetical protein
MESWVVRRPAVGCIAWLGLWRRWKLLPYAFGVTNIFKPDPGRTQNPELVLDVSLRSKPLQNSRGIIVSSSVCGNNSDGCEVAVFLRLPQDRALRDCPLEGRPLGKRSRESCGPGIRIRDCGWTILTSSQTTADDKRDCISERSHDLTRIRRKFVIKGEHFFV